MKTRSGAKVSRESFGELSHALLVIEARGQALQEEANAREIDLRLGRKFEPVQQVTARLELSGPGRLRGGIDVRGDGSAEAWTGRVRRKLVVQEPGESPYDALTRVMSSEMTGGKDVPRM